MLNTWHTIKAYVVGIVAFITCPCHLPLTLPLLISLTAGTAFSAWLAAPGTLLLVGVISTVVFIGGLALAFKWFTQPACATRPIPNATPSLPKAKPIN